MKKRGNEKKIRLHSMIPRSKIQDGVQWNAVSVDIPQICSIFVFVFPEKFLN